MNVDEETKMDGASVGDASGGQAPAMEEFMDLVDEVTPDDDSSQPEQAPEIESETEEDDQEIVELTDVVEKSSSEDQIGSTTLEGGGEEILEPDGEQGPEEDEPIELVDEIVPETDSAKVPEEGEGEPIELTDEVVPEADSAQELEQVVELGDLAEELGFDAEETESPELSEAEISILEPDEDSLMDTLGLELSEEGAETPVEEGREDQDFTIPEDPDPILLSCFLHH